MRDHKEKLYYGWVIVAACLMISLISYGIQYSFGVFFKPLESEFNWTRIQVSGVFSAYMLLHCILAFFAGSATDKFGPRKIVTFGGFFAGLGLILTSYVSDPWQLYLFYSLMLGLGISTAWTPIVTTTSRWFARRWTGLALGIVSAGVGLGTMILSPVASYLIATYGWNTSYFILGVAAWIIIISSAQLLRKEPPSTVAATPETISSTSQTNFGGFTLKEALRTRNLWLFYVMYILFAICIFVVMGHLVRHAEDINTSSTVAATFLSVIGVGSIIGRIAMGSISDRLGRKTSIIICSIVLGVMMFWLTAIESVWEFYVFSAIFGFCYGGTSPVVAATIGEIFGLAHLGAIYGSVIMVAGFGGAVGPLLPGYIYDVTNSYLLAFILGGVMSLVGALTVYFIKMPKHQ